MSLPEAPTHSELTGCDNPDNLEGILKSFTHFFSRDFLDAHFIPVVNDPDLTPALGNGAICFLETS